MARRARRRSALVLLDQREPVELGRRSPAHLEMVSTAAVDHPHLGRVRKRTFQQALKAILAHAVIVPAHRGGTDEVLVGVEREDRAGVAQA